MKVKALTGFAGAVCMAAGEVRNITDEVLVKDLIGAGYVETVETEQKESTISNSDDETDAELPEKEEKSGSKPAKRSTGKDADKQNNDS